MRRQKQETEGESENSRPLKASAGQKTGFRATSVESGAGSFDPATLRILFRCKTVVDWKKSEAAMRKKLRSCCSSFAIPASVFFPVLILFARHNLSRLPRPSENTPPPPLPRTAKKLAIRTLKVDGMPAPVLVSPLKYLVPLWMTISKWVVESGFRRIFTENRIDFPHARSVSLQRISSKTASKPRASGEGDSSIAPSLVMPLWTSCTRLKKQYLQIRVFH